MASDTCQNSQRLQLRGSDGFAPSSQRRNTKRLSRPHTRVKFLQIAARRAITLEMRIPAPRPANLAQDRAIRHRDNHCPATTALPGERCAPLTPPFGQGDPLHTAEDFAANAESPSSAAPVEGRESGPTPSVRLQPFHRCRNASTVPPTCHRRTPSANAHPPVPCHRTSDP